MRRVGRIFDQVLEMENLKLAFWKASRAKRTRADQRVYVTNLDGNLRRLRDGLRNGTYPVGNYRRFTIHDPKEREICAAVFGERVLHHALMNVCEPYFERGLIDKTFACRKGYGQLKAVASAHGQARRFGWYLKCDVRKYFDSIPHDGIRLMLSRKFKDPMVLGWFDRLIGTYETRPGRGLPIGNLTSQHLANLYLDRLDRFVLERLRECGVWDDEELQRRVAALTAFLEQADTLSWRRRNNDLDHRRTTSDDNRDLRGGSWNNNANNCRSANRNNNNPSNENNNNGFRLACSAASFPRRMIPAEILPQSDLGENGELFLVSSGCEHRERTIDISQSHRVHDSVETPYGDERRES